MPAAVWGSADDRTGFPFVKGAPLSPLLSDPQAFERRVMMTYPQWAFQPPSRSLLATDTHCGDMATMAAWAHRCPLCSQKGQLHLLQWRIGWAGNTQDSERYEEDLHHFIQPIYVAGIVLQQGLYYIRIQKVIVPVKQI